MTTNAIISFVIGSLGAFVIVSSILNLDYLFKSKRAEFYQKIFGIIGTRIFYGALGAFMVYIATQL